MSIRQLADDNNGHGSKKHRPHSKVKEHIHEIQKMGWKKFWKFNNKVVYFLLKVILALIAVALLLNTDSIIKVKTDFKWANYFILISGAIYTTMAFTIIHFYFKIGIKQDFNTDSFSRYKMSKWKGVDWKSAEEPYLKKKK